MSDANFTFPSAKVKAAAEKILLDCRKQNFTIFDFVQLIGELNQILDVARNEAEKKSFLQDADSGLQKFFALFG